ncbi:MAG: carbamoyl-phosphate synthase domain-containing protein, partial [Poseidonia sp.]
MLGGGIANTRSLPATHRLYNPSSLDIPDAADGLADKSNLPPGATGAGVLLTADGGRYPGELFGAQAIGTGELVFTTGMMGYQESLTDPSFAGQVLTFTYPLIGNYGVHIGASE